MNWPIAPILLPLVTAVAALFWGRPGVARRWFVALSAAAQLAVAIYLTVETISGHTFVLGLGAWSAKFGILLVVDLLSALMLTLSSLVALATILYGNWEAPLTIEHPLRAPLTQFLVMGINLTFCTGDLFNLFVAFEVMLIASYALLTLEADDWDIKHAFPYVAINLFGSALFICACGLAYALFGTLNFGEIILRAAPLAADFRLHLLALLLLGVLFLFQALSLAGVPPLSGFWGKYLIVVVGLQQQQYWLVVASILASILTLFSMLKIWNGAFWTESKAVPVRTDDRRWMGMTAVIAGLTCISLAIGLGAEAFVQIATQAAERVLDQQGYAQTVLSYLGKAAGGARP